MPAYPKTRALERAVATYNAGDITTTPAPYTATVLPNRGAVLKASG